VDGRVDDPFGLLNKSRCADRVVRLLRKVLWCPAPSFGRRVRFAASIDALDLD